jgi:large subunit ribosomal protein L18
VSTQKRIKERTKRRAFRVRNRLRQRANGLFRLSVFRSLNHIYAQIIDDAAYNTIASFSSQLLKDAKGDKKEIAKMVGLELGKLAKEASVDKVVFDRGSYLYHGRVKALADGLKESGVAI